jgi:hypothetical protein
MDRNNPYEAAFEGYLKHHSLCYVGIDEGRRSVFGEMPVKNLDFIVLGACGSRLLIDVKGRRFPGGPADKPRYVWENWATQEDLQGLRSWMEVFGPGYVAIFLFMYRIEPNVAIPGDTLDLWSFRERQYVLRAVTLEDYLLHQKVRSPKWGTVSLSNADYRSLARPFRYFTHELALPEEMRDVAPNGGDRQQGLESALAALAPARRQDGGDGP